MLHTGNIMMENGLAMSSMKDEPKNLEQKQVEDEAKMKYIYGSIWTFQMDARW